MERFYALSPAFQSTLPARGATDSLADSSLQVAISIHAPRTGSDIISHPLQDVKRYFNPRSPHGERQPSDNSRRERQANFNPRSPHGERLLYTCKEEGKPHISIHAPRTGSDPIDLSIAPSVDISIHAPRTGSDDSVTRSQLIFANFNPRSPHGERRWTTLSISPRGRFQSTLPARGATRRDACERDPLPFQSTLPARGATKGFSFYGRTQSISIHAPRTGSDQRRNCQYQDCTISIHAPRTGSDRTCADVNELSRLISIHAPRTGSD